MANFIFGIPKFLYIGEKAIITFIISFIKCFIIGLKVVILTIPKYFIIGILAIFGKRKTKDEERIVNWVLVTLALIVYLTSVFLITRWITEGFRTKQLVDDIIDNTEIIETPVVPINPIDPDISDGELEETPEYLPNDYWDFPTVPFINVNFDELIKKNSDTVGWLKVEGTNINYPIVQTNNNDFYMNHAFDKSYNSSGWVFLDYRNNFNDLQKNNIIFAHNMYNDTMFGTLPNLLNYSWFNNINNHYVRISTPNNNMVFQIFSAYMITPEIYYLKTVFTDNEFNEYIDTVTNRSHYVFPIQANTNDKILTLSTCDDTGNKRMVVHAKLISIETR